MRRSIAVVIGVLCLAALSGCGGGGNNPDGGAGGGSAGGGAGGGDAVGGGNGGSGGAGGSGGTGGAGGAGGGSAGPVLQRPDRSTPIALTTDDAILVSVNPDNDTVSIFNTANRMKTATVNTGAGSQPVSVSIHPNNTVAFVALRRSQELIKITGINTINPQVDATRAAVGSEPTGVALTPSGATAVVANFGEDRVSFVDTATMAVTHAVVGANPRALAITNDLDGDDSDETAYVTLFYGTPTAEASDTGRTGKVVPIPMGTRTPGAAISLAPILDTGFAVGGGSNVACSPNQLFGIAIDQGKAYVTHVCAAPQGPVNPLTNLFAGLSVINLSSNMEDTSTTGSVALSRLIAAQEMPAGSGSLLGVPISIDFKAAGVAYVVSQAADVVQRIQFGGTPPIRLGTAGAFAQINIIGNGAAGGANRAKVPIGGVTARTQQVMYVNNWIDRSITIIDLNNQQVDTVIESEPRPTTGLALREHQGKKFYFTGTGRWSTRGVNSCGSCHPDGLSDNLTWIFAAGPRQTTPMDGTFSKVDGEQRALNWTAIFDEVHDFELNTRGTAGGVGALVRSTVPDAGERLDMVVAQNPDGGIFNPVRHDNLSGAARQLMLFRSAIQDWDEINDFSKTIRANKKPTNLVAADVTAGQGIFTSCKCQNCHGGAKWTVSRVSYTPSGAKNGTAPATNTLGMMVGASGLRIEPLTLTASALPAPNNTNIDANKVAVERGLPDGGVVGPERITCALRRVGTFDINDPIEKKADNSQAQGIHGFNPPSLLGMYTSAPYFHAGKARTLNDLLTNPAYAAHLAAGAANCTLDATQARQLEAFINSIDDSTTPINPDNNTDTCTGY